MDATHLLINVSLDYAIEILDHGITHLVAIYGVKVAVVHTAATVAVVVKRKIRGSDKKVRIEPKL